MLDVFLIKARSRERGAWSMELGAGSGEQRAENHDFVGISSAMIFHFACVCEIPASLNREWGA